MFYQQKEKVVEEKITIRDTTIFLLKTTKFFFQQEGNNERKDTLICGAFHDKIYSVKKGYELIINSQRWDKMDNPLNLCWDQACLPRAGIFLWAASQNRIRTTDRFTKMGFKGPSRCPYMKY